MESGEPVVFLPSTNQVISRPNSLLGPDKEPVNFNINLVGAPPEVEQLVDHIKSVAEQFLYHWKTFPISLSLDRIIFCSDSNFFRFFFASTVLPHPLSGNGTNTNRRYRPINLRDLFIAPPFDELDVVAMDGTGEPRRLTNTQLKSLREKGFVNYN